VVGGTQGGNQEMKAFTLVLTGLTLLAGSQASQPKITGEKTMTTIKKITPVLFVEEIEPCLKFWVDRLGFQKTVEVPEGSKLGFVILEKDGVEVMYQTYASADKDVPTMSTVVRKGPTFLYVEVVNLDPIVAAMKGAEVVMPVRMTFYGAKEIGVKDPAGHFVTFAQMAAAPQH
jgi:uncharacterized glyoxalase superfamily protein PhnB